MTKGGPEYVLTRATAVHSRRLPQFSDRLLRRKVLPALLELMSDRSLLPFILPNVFHIAKTLSSIEFTATVLPRLQPLFSVQDPPQNQLMLLDQIELFVAKTSPPVFREGKSARIEYTCFPSG